MIAGSCTSPCLDSTSARHPSVRLGGSGLVPRASDGRLLDPSACLVRFTLLWLRVDLRHCSFAPRGAPVHASFPAYGSSPHTIDNAMKTGSTFLVSDGPFSDKRCLTSPSANVRHRVSPWSTSRKWAPFRVGSLKRESLRFFRLPYSPYYRAAFAFSGLFYPLRHRPSLPLGYRLRGACGAYPVSPLRRDRLATLTGVGGVCSPAGVGEHRRCQWEDNDPTRVPFWFRCIRSFHLFYFTSLRSTLHYRTMVRLCSPVLSFPALHWLELPMVGTLSPELRTLSYRPARPGRDIWMLQGSHNKPP